MNNIQMVDLQLQYERLKSDIDNGISEVISSAKFINGPTVSNFATNLAKYLNVKHVIPCANGTDALQIALMAAGIEPGDEVITPNFTFIATVEVVALLQAKPVLVDVNPDDFTININELKKLITPKTKAIVPVHLFGQCANMKEIMELAKKHNLLVIEDCAQSIGTDHYWGDKPQKAGTMGDFGCTSFFPSKNLGCYGDGGALYTNDDELASIAKSITNHGSTVKYHHDRIGVNSRLDSIQAAILNVKLKQLDDFNRRRQAAAIFYDHQLGIIEQIETPAKQDFSDHTYHQYTIKVPKGENLKLQAYLKEKGVPAMVYYPIPLHKQKAFEKWTDSREFPVSDELAERVLSLPMHTELKKEELTYICDTIKDYFNGK
ncbi:MAG: transcriptional regulator [Salinivirgaceae bacterium]|nr:MAG: transcriptional regulator [Salinivirgaceae bacterium]